MSVDGPRVAEIGTGDGLTDPTGNAEQVARLFQAVLDRQPDLGSLYMYANDVDQGTLSLAQLGTILASSPEFLQKYPAAAGTSASAQAVFVNVLYENLFGRPADGDGAGYAAALQGGESEGHLALDISRSVEARTDYLSLEGDRSYGKSRAQILADVSNGSEARAHAALATHDGWVLTT